MFDQNTGANGGDGPGAVEGVSTAFVAQKWCSQHVEKEVMRRDPKTGRLTAVYGYYDPELDHKHYFGSEERGAQMGLGIGWYLQLYCRHSGLRRDGRHRPS